MSDERFPPVPGAALSGDRYLAWVDRWPSNWEEGFGHLQLERSLFVYGDRDSPAREIALVPGREAFATRFTNEEQRRHALERRENPRVPDRTPAYGAFLVDSRGVLWLEEYRPAWEEEDRRWLAFDAEGVPAALVVFPPDLEARQIGDDFVLGTATDELGVEQVRLHRLIRDGPP